MPFTKKKNLPVDNFDNQGDTIHQLMQNLHSLKAKQEQDLEQSKNSLRQVVFHEIKYKIKSLCCIFIKLYSISV
jgi:hypothetical protein